MNTNPIISLLEVLGNALDKADREDKARRRALFLANPTAYMIERIDALRVANLQIERRCDRKEDGAGSLKAYRRRQRCEKTLEYLKSRQTRKAG